MDFNTGLFFFLNCNEYDDRLSTCGVHDVDGISMVKTYVGVSTNVGTPIFGWFIIENPMKLAE